MSVDTAIDNDQLPANHQDAGDVHPGFYDAIDNKGRKYIFKNTLAKSNNLQVEAYKEAMKNG